MTFRSHSMKFISILSGLALTSQASESEIRFGRDIRPILADKCFFCHGPDPETREEGLRLDIRENAIKAKAIIPGHPEKSKLIELINTHDEEKLMPPRKSHKKLSEDEKKLLQDWIKAGAEYEPHWAYQAPARNKADNIDALVEKNIKKKGLTLSAQTNPSTLIRRMHFDITGLPPTSEEVTEFITAHKKNPQQAVADAADKLLASPHFGERMAVKWLDLVRYADTVGYHGDPTSEVSLFRDYVINSFNNDLAYNQFIIEQIAGDLIPNPTIAQQIASSYNRLGQMSQEGGIQDKEYIAKYQSERVRTTSAAFLGSTMACAECHDHKFDPITAKDFYSFAAFFSDILEQGAWTGDGKYQEDPKKYVRKDVIISINNRENFGPYLKVSDQGDLTKIKLSDNVIDEAKPYRTVPMTISAKRRDIRLLARGNWADESGPIVQPAPPSFLMNGKTIGTTRLDLATWIASEENPLTARVFVNQVWSQFFGSGLSNSMGDFGLQGEYPSNLELLDWLAIEFTTNNWSVKQLIRTIVLSKTYQQTSTPEGQFITKDPQNRLLARQTQLRLPAELIRDNALAVSGLLNTEIGGRSGMPYQPAGYYRHLNFPPREYQASKGSQQYRRGIYSHWQRTFLHPMLKNFGAPAREECATDRPEANTPLQALTLLNDPSFTEAARVLATKLLKQSKEDFIQRAMMTCLSRNATDEELKILSELHQTELKRFNADPDAASKFISVGDTPPPPATEIPSAELAAATSLTRAILNLHETITRY